MPNKPSVDFLKQKYDLNPGNKRVKKTRRLARILVVVILFGAVSGVAFSYKLAQTQNNNPNEANKVSIFSSLRKLATASDKVLTGEDDDRINFLLLGIGGSGHAGPELTDTVILASFRPSTKETGMLSIPRDTIVEIPGHGYRKINHANALGEIDNKGSGTQVASEVIGGVLDQEIHYTIKVDFNGFADLINAIGGVDVYVERSFTDTTYPTEDDLVQTITFEKGWAHLDGNTALQYSRSRHGNNGEGSDFARAARQQKVILAVKDKVLSPQVLLNPIKLNKLIDTFQDNVQTNLTAWEIMKLARYAPDIDTNKISMRVLDQTSESPLYSTNINGAYVLMPKADNWSEVQEIAADIFTSGQVTQESPETEIEEPQNYTTIEIQNGTGVTGLAYETSLLLDGSGFYVEHISNADSVNYTTTLIYDLTNGSKDEELKILQEFLEADVSMTPVGWVFSNDVEPRELHIKIPDEMETQDANTIDFLIILGENAQDLVLR